MQSKNEPTTDPEFTARVQQAFAYAKEKGYVNSFNDVGEKMGVGYNVFNRYHNGLRPVGSRKTLARIAKALHVSLNWLSDGTGEMTDGQGSNSEPPQPKEDSDLPPPVAGEGCKLADREGYAQAEIEARRECPEWPSKVWLETREAMFRTPPEVISAKFLISVARAIFEGMSDDTKRAEWAKDANAVADLAESIRGQLRARGLDPKKNPLEWNTEFARLKSEALTSGKLFFNRTRMLIFFRRENIGLSVAI